jgi:hypothetical protein
LVAAAVTLTGTPRVLRRIAPTNALWVPLTLIILVEEPSPLGLVLASGALATFALETRQRPAGVVVRIASARTNRWLVRANAHRRCGPPLLRRGERGPGDRGPQRRRLSRDGR